MYAAAGGASLAGRKARQHGRQPAPPSPNALSPVHPAPSGVRLYSCQHWESRLLAPPPRTLSALEPPTPCDVVECAAGRAAWQEAAALSVGGGGAGAGGAARRCSVLGDHPGARGKWHRTNRVRDASYGSSSDSDVEEGAAGEPWGVARLLYAGLATLALGLVVYFVGTGDKGFKTPALRLVGPSLIVAGLACCLLRIMFCIFAKPCCRRRTNHKENRRLSGGVEGEEMPLARCAGSRQGPAQCSPARRLDASSCDVSSLSSGEEDERLRRYRTANATTTHLQPQTVHVQPAGSQQKPSPSPSPQPGSHQPVPQQSAPQQPTPIQPAPHQAASHQAAPLQPAPHQAAPLQPAPHQAASHQPTPHPSALHQSAPHQPAVPGKRPPPRNVSFAGGPDGELVLSPAQLRS